jgi:hypothetical protein
MMHRIHPEARIRHANFLYPVASGEGQGSREL